jgi:iron complex outermembrane receptor protein
MRKVYFLCSCLLAAVPALAGEPAGGDSVTVKQLEGAQVTSTRASEKTPMAFATLTRADLEAVNFGKDIPALLSTQPSVLASSDAGTGIGYSGLRVRGTDATRVNVTVGGIPINDSESNNVFWVNMPDLASSLGSIQLQRGIGTSTNGAGAFGATVNLETEPIGSKAFLRFDGSAGSYGTHKESLSFGTGLMGDHWGLSGRLSNIGSDGYIDRATSRLQSYFLQGGYFGDRTVVKFITFSGKEKTYHAWDYATKADMEKYGRTYNPCGKYKDDEGNTVFYKNQTDNYWQQHYHLLWNQRLYDRLNLNVALHYTHGDGYYEQYKKEQTLYKYRILNYQVDESDLVRQKKLDNDFYGTVFSLNYRNNRLQSTLGGGWNLYDGDHIGKVIWLRKPVEQSGLNHTYYNNNGKKQDFNVYGKTTYDIWRGLSAFADLQYRYVDYRMRGPSDQYDGEVQLPYNVSTYFHFFNPKAGLNWTVSPRHTVYASVALAGKEPTRNDYEDNMVNLPKAEHLTDYEVGYRLTLPCFTAEANLYYMDYKDQFVLTGEQNAIGEMIARNVGDSYRRGLEVAAVWQPVKVFEWNANVTWSHNRSKNLKFLLDDTGEYYNVKSAPLTFSPSLMFNNTFKAKWKGFTASLHTQYVDHQYMTATGLRSFEEDGKDVSLMLDAFCVSNLDVSYKFGKLPFAKGLTLGVSVYNLFGEKYESFGAAYTAVKSDGKGGMKGYQDDWWDSYSVYSAQAPAHFLVHLSINW